MKLAKKMLAGVIALAMVAALAVTVFAAGPALTLGVGDAVVGQNVTITVNASGIKGAQSGDLELVYDRDALQLVSANEGSIKTSMAVGGESTDGTATFSFAFAESSTEDAGTIAVYTFKALKEGTSDVTLKVNSWEGTDAPRGSTASVPVGSETTTQKPIEEDSKLQPPTEDNNNKGKKPTTPAKPSGGNSIPQTGEAGIAVLASVMAVAAVAFVATRKKEDK